jgi:hypothetical protein
MMMAVDWMPLVSTVAGAAIAIGGTVVADHLRRRDSRHRYSYAERQRAYSEMVLALGAALEGLRTIATEKVPLDRRMAAASDAVGKAGVYVAREKLLMIAPAPVARAAEAAFGALIGIRDAVRAGANRGTKAFHDTYHPYEDLVWRLRMAVRADLDAPTLHTEDLRPSGDLSGRANCDVCNRPAAQRVSPPVSQQAAKRPV